jgi:hypothetical protein
MRFFSLRRGLRRTRRLVVSRSRDHGRRLGAAYRLKMQVRIARPHVAVAGGQPDRSGIATICSLLIARVAPRDEREAFGVGRDELEKRSPTSPRQQDQGRFHDPTRKADAEYRAKLEFGDN